MLAPPLKFCVTLFVIALQGFEVSAKISGASVNSTIDLGVLLKSLFEDYDHNLRPFRNWEPTEVQVSMAVKSISSVSDSDFTSTFLLRQQWTDPRLTFDHLRSNISSLKMSPDTADRRPWTPDTLFPLAKSNVRNSKDAFTIFANGTVVLVSHRTMTSACSMDLTWFPFDTQECFFEIGTFDTDEVKYRWAEDQGLTIDEKFTLPQFRATAAEAPAKEEEPTVLRWKIRLLRHPNKYLLEIMIPLNMLVITSLLPLYLSPEYVAERIAIGVTFVLTLATMTQNVGQGYPKVPYATALDSYTGMCLTWVYAALLENAVVIYYQKKLKRLRKLKADADGVPDLSGAVMPEEVDRKARMILPIGYLLFSLGFVIAVTFKLKF